MQILTSLQAVREQQLPQNLLLRAVIVEDAPEDITASLRGPIDLPDPHAHCIACLGLAHAEAAFSESDGVH